MSGCRYSAISFHRLLVFLALIPGVGFLTLACSSPTGNNSGKSEGSYSNPVEIKLGSNHQGGASYDTPSYYRITAADQGYGLLYVSASGPIRLAFSYWSGIMVRTTKVYSLPFGSQAIHLGELSPGTDYDLQISSWNNSYQSYSISTTGDNAPTTDGGPGTAKTIAYGSTSTRIKFGYSPAYHTPTYSYYTFTTGSADVWSEIGVSGLPRGSYSIDACMIENVGSGVLSDFYEFSGMSMNNGTSLVSDPCPLKANTTYFLAIESCFAENTSADLLIRDGTDESIPLANGVALASSFSADDVGLSTWFSFPVVSGRTYTVSIVDRYRGGVNNDGFIAYLMWEGGVSSDSIFGNIFEASMSGNVYIRTYITDKDSAGPFSIMYSE